MNNNAMNNNSMNKTREIYKLYIYLHVATLDLRNVNPSLWVTLIEAFRRSVFLLLCNSIFSTIRSTGAAEKYTRELL
jgi:hypothetical protein